MKTLRTVALVYLIALIFMIWGFAVGKYQVFPYSIIEEVQEFIAGHPLGNETTTAEKFMSDWGIEPRRFMHNFPKTAQAGTHSIQLPNMEERRDNPLLFIAKDHQTGYRAVFGALDFEEAFWGGILLSPTGEILHTWKLSTDHLETNKTKDELKNLYGLHLFRDGSVIFTQQENGGGIVKVDGCGQIVWDLEGAYHHTITPTEDGDIWTFQGRQCDNDPKLVRISGATGDILSVIDMKDVRKANPHLHIFNLQLFPLDADISHANDIDPLPTKYAGLFKQFKAGDLLVSYRTQNMVFILDPDTLKIKWWRIGAWDRQHDPDWEPTGKIGIFSNNEVTDRKVSDIVTIDPLTLDDQIVVNGDDFDFYSRICGDHELTAFGTRMVTSTTQGWAFEVDQENQIVFSFVNVYDTEKMSSLNVSEAQRLPEDFFDEKFWETCGQ